MAVNAELSLVLDAIIVILVFVLLYLLYRKFIVGESRQAVAAGQSDRVMRLIEDRTRMRSQVADIRIKLATKNKNRILTKKLLRELLEDMEKVEGELASFGVY
jgi:ABC-type anion transport system duplicated permease subunit